MALGIQGQQEDVCPLKDWKEERVNGPKGDEPWSRDHFYPSRIFPTPTWCGEAQASELHLLRTQVEDPGQGQVTESL